MERFSFLIILRAFLYFGCWNFDGRPCRFCVRGQAGSWLSFMGVVRQEKVTGEIAVIGTRCSGLTVEPPEHFLGGFDAVELGFLKDGDPAQVGIGKEDAVIQTHQAAALFGKDGANGGADHGVAHAHDVDAGDALADIGMNALEVLENSFFPVGPIFLEEELAVLSRGAFGEGPIKCPDRAVYVRA